jgi:hypothetical protein
MWGRAQMPTDATKQQLQRMGHQVCNVEFMAYVMAE